MVLLFGPTGAGKSMQGQMLAARLGWKWLSTGEMFRHSDDPAVKAVLESGELVSDELTYGVFDAAIQKAAEEKYPNTVVDGFPRTKAQAEWLGEYLEKIKQKIDVVVVLEVPESVIAKRLALRARIEDTPEIIAKRMMNYRQKMYPVLGNFAEQGIRIVHLDGTGTAGEIHDRIYAEVMKEWEDS